MPLPPFDPNKIVSAVFTKRKGKMDVETNPEVVVGKDSIDPGLKEAATDILSAIQTKSVHELAMALQAAFEIMDSMPHEEGMHE